MVTSKMLNIFESNVESGNWFSFSTVAEHSPRETLFCVLSCQMLLLHSGFVCMHVF